MMPDQALGPAARGTGDALDAARMHLRTDLDAAASIAGVDAATLQALRDKLTARVFNLVILGEFKRGKSSVVNALLGAEVLPTGVVPLTSVVTVLRYGDVPAARVEFDTGAHSDVPLAALPDYVTERGNPRNVRHVREVDVAYPASWLGRGLRLVDTPGIGSAHQHNSDVTYAYLPEADAVIFVASVDQPVSRSELDFLGTIRGHANRIFSLLNKIDHLSAAEVAESVAFASAAIREALGTGVPVFPVSARLAGAARHDGDRAALERSGFAAFDLALQAFLAQDADAVLLDSVRAHLARVLAACRLAVELELKALAAPLATLESNLQAFAAKQADTLQQRSDFVALLEADARNLVKTAIEPPLADFGQALCARLLAQVPASVHAALRQHGQSPQAALDQWLVDAVRRDFDAFRAQEDVRVSAGFERICARFQQRMDASVDELLRYSAELFALHFEPTTVAPLRGARSRFYYKFWEDPDSLLLMTRTMAGWLPRAWQRPWLLQRARKRVRALVEVQSGRVRHDFAQRVEQATRAARRDMLARIDATAAAIEAAITKGRDLRARGAGVVATKRQELGVTLARIDELARR